ncbi:LysR family transcriptional regulator [Roseomonas sp. WA12]
MRHLRTLDLISDVARSGSIRRTAERMNISPSALTRQIQDFEQELGTPIFERLPHGMRANAAGEMVIRHSRDQLSGFERVRSQIADLLGERRGHVALACSQAFSDSVIPDEIQTYRARHPLVSFAVLVRDRSQAVAALLGYEVDLALILQPPPVPDLRVLFEWRQPLYVLMRKDHPLAGTGPVRLRDCLVHPLAMPGTALSIRHLLDAAVLRAGLPARAAVESDNFEFLRGYVRREALISFQVPGIATPDWEGICARPVDERDMPAVQVVLGQLRGRSLSVAAAKFADQVARSLHSRQGTSGGE